ncbi:macrophage mannose receptor 1-like isoform X2 [Plectropomus leopardus]|uniref:macrophage mannose receptor 1-like isoform X2 n=1 Tax=Plectropomus leopardus TaxID=160734 RepID=UPI001C4B32B2|nr:macrophage mannose receptor 1-like isoform X2 [Plectropomus leopardus]
MKSSAVRHFRRISAMKITCTAFMLLIQTLQCLALDDSPFQLTNKDTGFCLVKTNNQCTDVRWTTGDRLLVQQRNKCLGAEGKSVGSEISLYDCDEHSDLQKWQCKNETVLALKDQELYIELTADNTAALSKKIGPNNHLIISGTFNGACARTHRELYAIGGNAVGLPCMFPFQYNDQWFSDCTALDSPERKLWCAVETKYQSERWGYCPVTSRDGWTTHPTTGAYYQLNTQAALTWPQAEASCKQQGASLLSITDPHEQVYITALLGKEGNKLWTGLFLDPEHGWKWSNGRPYRYLKWDSGHPTSNPGQNCAVVDPAVKYSWQSSLCSKKLGYICYSKEAEVLPTQAVETGFCSRPWIPYRGNCFHLNRTQKTWPDAQQVCRNEGGDLVSISNVEDQSFVISQLGYTSADELWIGLNDRKTEGLFEWIDHSTVSFTSWEFGKPAVSTNLKDCVLIKGENGNWADHVCEEKHGYICMKNSASKPSGDEVAKDVGCKTGWRRHGSYCYFMGRQTKTFDDAKDDCKSSESYLADVSNGVDNAFLVSLVGMRPEKYFWLGLSNQKNIDQFVWTNQVSVKFTHWNAEMPGDKQGCVAVATGFFAGLWDVLPCTNKEKYICKHLAEGAVLTPAPPTFSSTGCAADWTRIGARKYCYKAFRHYSSSGARTWYEARDFCRAIGGDLLSIHSADEMQILEKSYENFWIGLSAPDPVTGYVWSDGSPLQFQHWGDGEPNNRNNVESCVVLYSNGQDGYWSDVHCESTYGYLCQIRKDVTPNPSPAPVTPDYHLNSDGWLEWNGSQYYIDTWRTSMESARNYCQRKHSDLVIINSEAESVFLWKQISKTDDKCPYWIGLDVDLDGTSRWMDGSPVVFQRWDENQPEFKNNDENCAAITPSLGFWHDYNCGYETMFICKRSESSPTKASVTPKPLKGGCPHNWKKIDSKCYSIIHTQRATWFEARAQCRSMGGNLASITSKHVQVSLIMEMAELPTTDLWIGLYSLKGNPFLWTDGRPVGFINLREMRHRYGDSENQCVVITTNPNSRIGTWVKKSCNDTNGYICLQNADPSLPDSPEPTTSTDYVKVFNDSIKIVTQPMKWDEAKKHCENDGAKLASLRNEWTKIYTDLLVLNHNAPLWIGLNKEETGGYFRYIDGWHVTSTYWDSWEPRRANPCVCINDNGEWETANCNLKLGSICMKSTDVPPTESHDFPGVCPEISEEKRYYTSRKVWLPFRAHCYLFVTDTIEWTSASTECAMYGGTLASIEDPTEQAFIKVNAQLYRDSEHSFWIGLYKTHRGTWQWLDKTAMDYTNWREGEPEGNNHDHVLIQVKDGTWTAAPQRYNRAYICKAAKVPKQAPQTTVNPTMDPQIRGYSIVAVVLVITAIAIGTAIALFLFKKSGRRLPIPEKLSTLYNPLFINNERYQPGMVTTNVANAEEEKPAPVITV